MNTYISKLRITFAQETDNSLREFLIRLFRHDASLCADIIAELGTEEGSASDEKLFLELGPHEVNLCGFLVLGVSDGEIADRTESSPAAVGHLKRQLLKKFGCADDAMLVARLRPLVTNEILEELPPPKEPTSGSENELDLLESEWELAILLLLYKGFSADEIAQRMGTPLSKVSGTIESLCKRFKCADQTALLDHLRKVTMEYEASLAEPLETKVAEVAKAEGAAVPATNGVSDPIFLLQTLGAFARELTAFKVVFGIGRVSGTTTLSSFKITESGTPQAGNGVALVTALESLAVKLSPRFVLEYATESDGDKTTLSTVEIKKAQP